MPIKRAYLFGSYAHGQPKPWSDVDVAVVSPKFIKHGVFNESPGANRVYDRALSISEEEFSQAAPGSFLLEEIAKKGIPLI